MKRTLYLTGALLTAMALAACHGPNNNYGYGFEGDARPPLSDPDPTDRPGGPR